MHHAQDLAHFQTVQLKKALRREVAKAKKERRELMVEAQALFKESTRADMQGDVEQLNAFTPGPPTGEQVRLPFTPLPRLHTRSRQHQCHGAPRSSYRKAWRPSPTTCVGSW